MSTLSYQREYQQIISDIKDVQLEDEYVSAMRVPSGPKQLHDHYAQYWVSIYVRYVRLARRLCVVHDVELQPQRRIDVRALLDSCLGRMLEARERIVAHCGDFLALDDVLREMQLTPQDLEAPIPRYISEDREEDVSRARTYISSLQSHYMDTDSTTAPVAIAALNDGRGFTVDPTKALAPLPTKAAKVQAGRTLAEVREEVMNQTSATASSPMDLEEAVRVLQLAERGRQARQRFAFQAQLHRQQQYAAAHAGEYASVTGKDRAATVVQKVVLGYLERRRAATRLEAEQKLLRIIPSEEHFAEEERLGVVLRHQERKARQRVNQTSLQQKTMNLESQLKASEGPRMMEEMLDEVLMHMAYVSMESKGGEGVQQLPPPAEGGSLRLLGRLGPTPRPGAGGSKASAGSRAGRLTVRSASSAGAAASRTSFAADAMNSKTSAAPLSASKRRSVTAETADATPATPSTFWQPLRGATERYESVWRDKFTSSYQEGGDLDQKVDEEMLRGELLNGNRGVMMELRQCVDQLVTIEVENLLKRLDDEKRRGKKGKKKSSKGKKKKGPKKPKLKDPTKGVDLETMYNTAIFENKLQLPPGRARLTGYLGSRSVMANPLDKELRHPEVEEALRKKWQRILRGWTPEIEAAMGGVKKEALEKLYATYAAQESWLRDPCAAEVRTAIAEYVVLPLGSQVINDLAPHPRGVFLYGPHGSGKTLLSFGAANEAGAHFFNLSPSNFAVTAGMPKLVQLLFYVARMKAPSIIYLDELEKIFPAKGKAGKANKKDPAVIRGKKLKKELIKGLNSLQPEDRVQLIGTSATPWAVDLTQLCKYFQRAVHTSAPDYASRKALLESFIARAVNGDDAADAGETVADALLRGPAEQQVVQQLCLMMDGLTAGQIESCVTETLHARRVARLSQLPLTTKEFIPTLSAVRPMKKAEREQFTNFQATLPVSMRRANAAEDFVESEEAAKPGRSKSIKKK